MVSLVWFSLVSFSLVLVTVVPFTLFKYVFNRIKATLKYPMSIVLIKGGAIVDGFLKDKNMNVKLSPVCL